MNVAQETLGFRRAGLSPALSLLMSAFALPIPPAGLTPHLQRPTERSPTISTLLLLHFFIRIAAAPPASTLKATLWPRPRAHARLTCKQVSLAQASGQLMK